MSRKLLLIIFLISQNAYSVNSDEFIEHFLNDQKKLLRIDFFIIQNLIIDEIDLKEKWKILDSFNFSNELIEIQSTPTTLVNLPTAKETKIFDLPKINLSLISLENDLENDTIEIKKPQPFLYERIPFQNEMKDIEDNLNRSRDYRVIYYNSWYQPSIARDKSIPVYIESFKKDKKVYGEIKIYKERFLHLDSNLRFSERTNDLVSFTKQPNLKNFQNLLATRQETIEEKGSNENYWIATIFNTVKLNLQNISGYLYSENQNDLQDLIINKESFYEFKDLYEINKKSKLETEKFNLIDHPYFSILIRVTETSI